MPLRCRDRRTSEHIHAFDVTEGGWHTLRSENRVLRHLAMPCCEAPVILKTSHLGTRFFAHKGISGCESAPETEIHRYLKEQAVVAARANGWSATTEVTGQTPSGERWRADVLAQKGCWQVAIEIQWSRQTSEELLHRQDQYKQSGIRGLWLLRQSGFPIIEAFPAAQISGTMQEGFSAFGLPVEEVLGAAFSERLKFGVPLAAKGRVSISRGQLTCWRSECGKITDIITRIAISIGQAEYRFSIPDIGNHNELWESISDRVPKRFIQSIRQRYSNTQGRTYLSNGCSHCGSLIGEFFERYAWYDQEVVYEYPVEIDRNWLSAINSHPAGEPNWGVYSF